MPFIRGTVSSQQFVTGGVTVEGVAIQTMTLKELEHNIDLELADLKKEMMKEIKKLRRPK